jgi:hypothetical protein
MPLHTLLLDEPEVRFIDQSRCLQRVTNMFSPHIAISHPAQFPINQGH